DAYPAAGDARRLCAGVRGAHDAAHADCPERRKSARDAPQPGARAGGSGRARAPDTRPSRHAPRRRMTEAVGRYLAMGDYAAFVWPAYGVALVVLGGLAWQAWRRYPAGSNTVEQLQREFRTRR